MFASPERKLLFDVNDFDETLPGPFEYDVKRMAASFTIAARNNGFSEGRGARRDGASVSGYRKAMAEFAAMRTLDIWYAHMSEPEFDVGDRYGEARRASDEKLRRQGREEGEKRAEGAHARQLTGAFKAGEMVDGRYRIVSQPPIVVPLREFASMPGVAPRGA